MYEFDIALRCKAAFHLTTKYSTTVFWPFYYKGTVPLLIKYFKIADNLKRVFDYGNYHLFFFHFMTLNVKLSIKSNQISFLLCCCTQMSRLRQNELLIPSYLSSNYYCCDINRLSSSANKYKLLFITFQLVSNPMY